MSSGYAIPIEDGSLYYDPHFLGGAAATSLRERLIDSVPWKQEPIVIFGKSVMQPRLTAWYGDPDTAYSYSGIVMEPLSWPDYLLEIKSQIEAVAEARFNSVLLNYYRDGQDSMGWHSDNEPELGTNPVIASLSLGGTRRFHLKHRQRKELETIRMDLSDGSLLVMGGALQHHWLHQISKTKKQVAGRINLTFRWVHGGK
ncbi:MAG: alpha-ketoglutarate-dependent dioxygenase AlkB [Bacteroidota bacterium]